MVYLLVDEATQWLSEQVDNDVQPHKEDISEVRYRLYTNCICCKALIILLFNQDMKHHQYITLRLT